MAYDDVPFVELPPKRMATWTRPSTEPSCASLELTFERETPRYKVFVGNTDGREWMATIYVRKGTLAPGITRLRLTGIEPIVPTEPEPGAPVRRVIELED